MPATCFLCGPDPRLIVERRRSTFTMVGLGPITQTYCVLAASSHVRSLADLCTHDPSSVLELQAARGALEGTEGALLLTEHGRVPVCRDDGDEHEQHCFHAHALLFSSKADIATPAKSYYGQAAEFEGLGEALAFAAGTEHYLLISPSAQRHLVLSRPLNAPRQLARSLVAVAENLPHLADWRTFPQPDKALELADALRRKAE